MRIPVCRVVVRATRWLTPRMRRVTFGGPGLDGFASNDAADERVKLLLSPSGGRPALPQIDERGLSYPPGAERPVSRTFTVRRFDPDAVELEIDIAHHNGRAAAWAARAQPGDEAAIAGPTGGYESAASPGCHLLAGDETALPAIATILERLPAGASAEALIEIGDRRAELELTSRADVRLRWLERNGARAPAGALLVEAMRALAWPPETPRVWAAGEALAMRAIRRHLRDELGLARDRFQVVGYWRDSLSEDEAIEAHLAAQEAARGAGASEAEVDDAGLY
ncbi:MAG: siderophore-interacting protein [Solirubrobacterales bacterium]|nr:siderophore-interacting protein [Solirubrobacterales bacterium]